MSSPVAPSGTVQVSDLWVSYRRAFRRDTVLRGLNLQASVGEIVAIVGRNGEGKTTLFRSLIGLQAPDRGRVTIDGLPPERYRCNHGIGFMPESLEFPPSWTVDDILGRGVDLTVAASARSEALELAMERGLFDAATRVRTASRCSKGIRQRLALAYALVGEPKVVILDEPFANLDPPSRIHTRDEIRKTAERGATVLLASHDLGEVARLAGSIFLMSGGVLRAAGGPDADGDESGGSLEAIFVDNES